MFSPMDGTLGVMKRHILVGMCLLIAVTVSAAVDGVFSTIGSGALRLASCVVPPAVVLMVWRGAPPLAKAAILHAVDRGKSPLIGPNLTSLALSGKGR
jgi:hypothetical protein